MSNNKVDWDIIAKVLQEFNVAWLVYWDAYVDLQNQLYESVKAARDVSWLAATDTDKLSRLNNAQRELFASMPRRMDYMPLGQVSRSLDNATSKLDELDRAMDAERIKCLKLIDAIEVIRSKIKRTRQELENNR